MRILFHLENCHWIDSSVVEGDLLNGCKSRTLNESTEGCDKADMGITIRLLLNVIQVSCSGLAVILQILDPLLHASEL